LAVTDAVCLAFNPRFHLIAVGCSKYYVLACNHVVVFATSSYILLFCCLCFVGVRFVDGVAAFDSVTAESFVFESFAVLFFFNCCLFELVRLLLSMLTCCCRLSLCMLLSVAAPVVCLSPLLVALFVFQLWRVAKSCNIQMFISLLPCVDPCCFLFSISFVFVIVGIGWRFSPFVLCLLRFKL